MWYGFAVLAALILLAAWRIMSALDDLNTAVTANTAATQSISAAITSFEGGAVSAAGVEAAVSQINANNAALTAATATLQPPATPPATS